MGIASFFKKEKDPSKMTKAELINSGFEPFEKNEENQKVKQILGSGLWHNLAASGISDNGMNSSYIIFQDE